jgi:PAS domain S-box-containing protein
MGEKAIIYDTHFRLSTTHEAAGNLAEAFEHYKQFEQLKSSVLEVSKQGEIDARFVNSLLQKSQEEKAALAQANVEIEEKNKEVRKLSIVANKMSEAMVIADAEGRVEYMNDSLIRNSGYTREGFEEQFGTEVTLQQMSSRTDLDQIIEGFHTSSKTVKYDSPHTMKSGKVMWTAGSLSPVYKDGKLDKIVVVYLDITERKQATDELTQINKDIFDSLHYAKSIQEAILPPKELFADAFQDAFVFYEPRDIVSGDFYWFEQRGPISVFAVVDCTGHGVPGAFMSLMGNDYLASIITDQNITTPGHALSMLNARILQALKQTGAVGESKDGMDVALCAYNQDSGMLQYAGARNPLYIVRDGDLQEIKATKESVGGDTRDKTFQDHQIQLQSGDQIYLFSDGYADQFGGKRGKKLMYKPFKKLLLDNSIFPMKKQLAALQSYFYDWKGDLEQVDDVCVLGVKI